MGDFNINFEKENKDLFLEKLSDLGFKQIVHFPTHIEGGIIDLVFSYSPKLLDIYTVEQQSPYFSDHDILFVKKKTGIKIYFHKYCSICFTFSHVNSVISGG